MKFLLLIALIWGSSAHAALILSPETVVDRILNAGRASKEIDLKARDALTTYLNTFAAYDFDFTGKTTYEDSRIVNLSGSGNLRDRTTIWSALLSKRLPTGTVLELGYNRTTQRSLFRGSSSRSPRVVYDVGELTLTQDLLGNFFGIAERKNLEAAEQLWKSSELEKKERQETLVLDSLRLFWDTFVARESLEEAEAQRDKYEALVKEVQNKSRLGFSNPGDLPKAKAEYGAQLRNLRSSTFTYLKNLDLLLTAMRVEEGDRDVAFNVSEDLPPLPTMVMPDVKGLRNVRVSQTIVDSADLARHSTELSVRWPELKLIASAGLTGLDPSGNKAFSDMASRKNPEYLVGLELNYKFFSDGNLARLNGTTVDADRAFNNLQESREESRRDVSTAMENVRFTYAAAQSAIDEMKQWDEAVRAQERSYRQGRLDFSQLIQDYNSYFRARATRIRSIGDYHIALHAYAAAVDELVK